MTRHGKANASSVGEGSSCTGASDSATLATTQQSGESQAEGNTAFAGQAVEQIKPWLSRLGQAKPRSRKPSLKLVRSSLQNLETSSLNQMHLSNMHPLSTKSRPSLLNRMNMETELLTPHTERVRMSLVTEVSAQMPWFSDEKRIRKSITNLSCNKTRDILDIFQRDYAAVKRWIRCAASAPAGFPST